MFTRCFNRMFGITGLVAITIVLSTLVHAQIGGGSIVGNITDQSAAAVPGAVVRATNAATNVANSTTTNEEGYYEFPLLPPGEYVLEISATGFAARRSNPFQLNTGTRPRFDFTLGVGDVTAEVSVTGESQLVNSTNTELGAVVEQRKIQNLPLNGRNYESFLGLQSGAVVRPATTVSGRGGTEFNGASAFGNNLTLDGVDVSFGEHNGSAQSSGLGGSASINAVSVDALQEVTSIKTIKTSLDWSASDWSASDWSASVPLALSARARKR